MHTQGCLSRVQLLVVGYAEHLAQGKPPSLSQLPLGGCRGSVTITKPSGDLQERQVTADPLPLCSGSAVSLGRGARRSFSWQDGDNAWCLGLVLGA